LCINKIYEVYNSKLTAIYCQINPDFQKLALFLKNWNKKRFPDNQTRLNSFSMITMLLAYMQSLNQLPNLQNFDDERKGLTDTERPTNYRVQRISAKV
jgi:DNA polymerase sigma